MRKMTTAGFLESCNAGGHLQVTSLSLAISNATKDEDGVTASHSKFYCGQERGHALARALVAMKSLASSSCSVMCGKPSQQTRKCEIACVRNKLFSLARIASKESQRATKVTSGDSDLPDAKARRPRYRLAVVPVRQVKTEYSGSLAPCRG